MAFNVNDFRQNMNFDGARPNLFDVRISYPAALIGAISGYSAAAPKSEFLIKSAQLPGSTLGTVSVNYFGRELKFAGNRTFQDWTVTVINDEDFAIRAAMESWMSQINSHVGNTRYVTGNSPLGYGGEALVSQYGKTGTSGGPIKKIKIVGMFPIDLSPIDLDWGSNDAIEEFSVTFAYQYWVDDTTGVKNPSGVGPTTDTSPVGNN
jgi:hypothetical protein